MNRESNREYAAMVKAARAASEARLAQPSEPVAELNKQSLSIAYNNYNKLSLDKHSLSNGYKNIPPKDFAFCARHLTSWGIPAGIIKSEGPGYVLYAVNRTLQDWDKIRTTPKNYFNGVLRKEKGQQAS